MYTLPEVEELSDLSPQTKKKAKSCCLPPQQEFLRISIIKALVKCLPFKKTEKKSILLDKLKEKSSINRQWDSRAVEEE